MAKMYNRDFVAPVLNPQQISGFQAGKVQCYSSVLSEGLRGQAQSRSLQRKSIYHHGSVRNSSPVPNMSSRVCLGIFICFCSAFSGNVLYFSFKNFAQCILNSFPLPPKNTVFSPKRSHLHTHQTLCSLSIYLPICLSNSSSHRNTVQDNVYQKLGKVRGSVGQRKVGQWCSQVGECVLEFFCIIG